MDLHLTNNGVFKDFSKKRDIGDWSVVVKVLLVSSSFFQYWVDNNSF